jgi:hypothetical protein
MELSEALREWHDFYVVIGTASATLIGLLFVAASIGAGFLTERHRAGFPHFVSPTVVHFTAVLASCLLILMPFQTWHSLGALALAGAAAGVAYTCTIWLRMRRRGLTARIDVFDRLWYTRTPVVCYALLIGAGAALLMRSPLGLDLLALALLLLLLISIRNAWDMTLWMVTGLLGARNAAEPSDRK